MHTSSASSVNRTWSNAKAWLTECATESAERPAGKSSHERGLRLVGEKGGLTSGSANCLSRRRPRSMTIMVVIRDADPSSEWIHGHNQHELVPEA